MDYKTISLIELSDMCNEEDPKALDEWKRRWEKDYPEMKCGE